MTGRIAKTTNPRTTSELCDEGDRYIESIGRSDIRWVMRGGRIVIEWILDPVTGYDSSRARRRHDSSR